jgi:hypothetical protein
VGAMKAVIQCLIFGSLLPALFDTALPPQSEIQPRRLSERDFAEAIDAAYRMAYRR